MRRNVFLAVAIGSVVAIGAVAFAATHSSKPSLPLATTAEFHGLRLIAMDAWTTAGGEDPESALIVSTKRHSAFGQLPGRLDPRHDPTVYLVQVIGTFPCICRGPGRGGPPRNYRVLSLVFDPVTGNETDSGLTDRPGDLNRMGTPYRLPTPAEVR